MNVMIFNLPNFNNYIRTFMQVPTLQFFHILGNCKLQSVHFNACPGPSSLSQHKT